jgi:hypothetical protein
VVSSLFGAIIKLSRGSPKKSWCNVILVVIDATPCRSSVTVSLTKHAVNARDNDDDAAQDYKAVDGSGWTVLYDQKGCGK